MRQLAATLRHRPGPLVGTFVALIAAAVVVTIGLTLGRVGGSLVVPTQRLAGAAAVISGHPKIAITTGHGDSASTDHIPLNAYRRLPASLSQSFGAVPGVAAAVPDVSVPVALQGPGGRIDRGAKDKPLTAHGWSSAVLTPFTLARGHTPGSARQIVVGSGVARMMRLRVGDTVRLVGRATAPLHVVGIAGTRTSNPAADWTVFLSDTAATALYAHPGQADLIGILRRPGTPAAALDARLREVARAHGVTASFGNARGAIENLADADEGSTLTQVAVSAGTDLSLIALFVVAGAVALSVAQRSRTIALLRAVGATPGQVRRMLALELGVTGMVAGLVGYFPGVWVTDRMLRGMAAHQLVPPGTRAPVSWLSLVIVVAAGVVVAELSGYVASRRAGRLAPSAAMAEAVGDRRWPGATRTVGGAVCLAGGLTAVGLVWLQRMSATQQLSDTLLALLAFLASLALLGPLLVAAAEWLLRRPLRALSPVAGRLALAEVRVRPRRMASAVMAVGLAVAFGGAIYSLDGTQTHAGVTQGPQRLAANEVVTAPGPGLSPTAVERVRATPGVSAAVGITPTTIYLPEAGDETTSAVGVTSGSLDDVLHLDVTSGSLAHFGPGDIALSRLETGSGAINVRIGQRVTAHLADGTRYRARVVAVYDRSVGFADAIVPAGAAGGGHLGTDAVGEVLVRTSAPARLAALDARYPGAVAAGRTAVNAQDQKLAEQGSYINDLALWILLALAGVTVVNTLVVTTLDRREVVHLLSRVGTTGRQLLAATAWQAVVLGAIGIVFGAAAGGAAVTGAVHALTGNWRPYVPLPTVIGMVAGVAALTLAATVGPTVRILRQRSR
ncbi:MAG TPA: FtsX-like permease family protein [Acidimicrobiales bacterium]|nr:FtsX-like permease family protein [Acidimicrobiales bacterium]